MSAQLLSTSEGATLILTLSNPEHKNALGPEIYAAGVEALSVAETSPEIKSVVITGEGAVFSAGGNLQRLNNNRELFQSPSLQQLKVLQQAQDFLWLWPAT
jgi:enoyl-CoA hydratase/carnithine racemase